MELEDLTETELTEIEKTIQKPKGLDVSIHKVTIRRMLQEIRDWRERDAERRYSEEMRGVEKMGF